MPVPAATRRELLVPRDAPDQASPRAWGVDVVDGAHAQLGAGLELGDQACAGPAGQGIGRRDHGPGGRVDDPGRTDADPPLGHGSVTAGLGCSRMAGLGTTIGPILAATAASAMTAAAASAMVSRIACAPALAGVGTVRTCPSTPSTTDPARIFVPPTSTAMIPGSLTAVLRR
jgi:hypothetical protein